MGSADTLSPVRLCPAPSKTTPGLGTADPSLCVQGCLLVCACSCLSLVSPLAQKGPSVPPTLLITLPRQPRLERWGFWAGDDPGHVGSRARLSAREPDLEPGPALAGGHQSCCHLASIWLNQEIGRQGVGGLWAS